MTECIEICMDVRSNSMDGRSNSMDARSNSMDARSNSMDSHSESIAGSFEEVSYMTNKERKNSSPIIDFLIMNVESNKEKVDRRRIRDMKLYGKSPDEPKTIEQVKNELYIFNSKYGIK